MNLQNRLQILQIDAPIFIFLGSYSSFSVPKIVGVNNSSELSWMEGECTTVMLEMSMK
jgi:hypothetical protein